MELYVKYKKEESSRFGREALENINTVRFIIINFPLFRVMYTI